MDGYNKWKTDALHGVGANKANTFTFPLSFDLSSEWIVFILCGFSSLQYTYHGYYLQSSLSKYILYIAFHIFIISFLCNLFSTFHLHYIQDVPLSTTLCNFRAQYRVDAQAAYQQKMLKAFAGKGDFPKIRTFNKSDISTNSVYKDLEAAEKMYVIPSDFIQA